ncbi:MAG: 23S rRNA (uracil(1939)-C(5))-methyltransferase RlmD [Hydrogenophilus sp.]|nr:23S rRNA (uracil(1939)-C(5))-methyltransferase RlmD [Hydrogenophilus sp.]
MKLVQLRIESLDLEGRGIGQVEGKRWFVQGGLPGEVVWARRLRERGSYTVGECVEVVRPSAWRVTPRCPHFGRCGGCAMQHLEANAQVAVKGRALEDALWHVGRVRGGRWLAPIYGPSWFYRYRARLGVRWVAKKGGVLVGFRERCSSFVAELSECPVLAGGVGELIEPMRALVGSLSIADRVPQVEVAVGEGEERVLVFRHLLPLSGGDEERLKSFGRRYGVGVWVQPGGAETMSPLLPEFDRPLLVHHPEFGVQLRFRPSDFTQVNFAVNQALVRRAVGLLAIKPGERVADWFAGLGNFTLPIARCGANTVGVEGSESMVYRATELARAHGLEGSVRFYAADLSAMTTAALQGYGRFEKWLVDPPREGAAALMQAITPEVAPQRIVYVSCHPATLARDAAILVHTKGYRLTAAGVANMFPHTGHVEAVAIFDLAER